MNTAFLITGVIIILAISLIVRVRLKKPGTSADAKKPLTEIEQLFFHRLTRALPENVVLAQVPLPHFLRAKKGFGNWEWSKRIKRMSVNFLICRQDSSVIAAIELDDSSDNQDQHHERDKKKNLAIKAAGIVLIRSTQGAYPPRKPSAS